MFKAKFEPILLGLFLPPSRVGVRGWQQSLYPSPSVQRAPGSLEVPSIINAHFTTEAPSFTQSPGLLAQDGKWGMKSV